MEPQWLRMAKGLAFGQRRKIVCCGSSPSMIINHGPKGYSAHCFRDSGHGGFVPHGLLTPAEIAARTAASAVLSRGPLTLPKDATEAIPSHARLWLLRASVDDTLSRHYRIVYSPKTDRVIVPVYVRGELVAFIARAVGKQSPKYIARHKDGHESAVFTSDDTVMLPADVRDSIPPYDLLVTEDVLSAVRTGRLVHSRSILGTTAKEKGIGTLSGLRDNPTVGVWLDGDKAGRKGRDRVATDLALLGARVIKITTPLDPKRYSNREIKEILVARYSPS